MIKNTKRSVSIPGARDAEEVGLDDEDEGQDRGCINKRSNFKLPHPEDAPTQPSAILCRRARIVCVGDIAWLTL